MTTKRKHFKRNDIHSPSQIVPSDYEFVAFDYIKVMGIEDAHFLKHEREMKRAHMSMTKGKYSRHEQSEGAGGCQCCGANAVYTCTFYHQKSNEYIHVGSICADKLDLSYSDEQFNLFKKSVRLEIKIAKGKANAQRILAEIFYENQAKKVWDIYNTNWHSEEYKGRKLYEEITIRDMITNVVRYGDFKSNKQIDFMKNLLNQIDNREVIAKRRADERANAAECPNGRVTFVGEVISIKEQVCLYGYNATQLKMLVKSETGFMAYGSVPSGHGIQRGSVVEFSATFKQSANDPKFGYFKRPSKCKVKVSGETDLEEILRVNQ